jgi:hypothetical protein
MTIAAKARAAVNLACDIAEMVPSPPGGRLPDPMAYRAWEDFMLTAASRLAVTVGYDCEVLDAAVGPAIQVGVNPPWRVLLQIAQLEAKAHAARGSKRLPDNERNVVSLRRAGQERAEDNAQASLHPAAMWGDAETWLEQPAGGLA